MSLQLLLKPGKMTVHESPCLRHRTPARHRHARHSVRAKSEHIPASAGIADQPERNPLPSHVQPRAGRRAYEIKPGTHASSRHAPAATPPQSAARELPKHHPLAPRDACYSSASHTGSGLHPSSPGALHAVPQVGKLWAHLRTTTVVERASSLFAIGKRQKPPTCRPADRKQTGRPVSHPNSIAPGSSRACDLSLDPHGSREHCHGVHEHSTHNSIPDASNHGCCHCTAQSLHVLALRHGLFAWRQAGGTTLK